MEKIIQQYNENTITKAEYVKIMSHLSLVITMLNADV